MRELTDSERIARDVAKSSRDVPYLADDLEHYIFDMGFSAALDHTDAQIAALQAERDALRDQLQAMLNVFGHPGLPEGSIARYACDEARRVLGEESNG